MCLSVCFIQEDESVSMIIWQVLCVCQMLAPCTDKVSSGMSGLSRGNALGACVSLCQQMWPWGISTCGAHGTLGQLGWAVGDWPQRG